MEAHDSSLLLLLLLLLTNQLFNKWHVLLFHFIMECGDEEVRVPWEVVWTMDNGRKVKNWSCLLCFTCSLSRRRQRWWNCWNSLERFHLKNFATTNGNFLYLYRSLRSSKLHLNLLPNHLPPQSPHAPFTLTSKVNQRKKQGQSHHKLSSKQTRKAWRRYTCTTRRWISVCRNHN